MDVRSRCEVDVRSMGSRCRIDINNLEDALTDARIMAQKRPYGLKRPYGPKRPPEHLSLASC